MSTYDNIDVDTRKQFYKALVTKSFTEAGREIGLDRKYNSDSSLRAASYKLYKELDPIGLGFDKDIVDMVSAAIEQRKAASRLNITEVDNTDIIDPEDTKQVIIGGRNKAAMLLHKKMDRLSKNKKLLDATTLTQLATTFGIFFDKAQILNGQATENIAMMAKIDTNMTPEESLEALLRMREKVTE
jgi:hypothetical protein